MDIIKLNPTDGRKSFYNKAIVFAERNFMVLRSYDTAVIALYRGRVYKLWDGYSVTTMRHINAFLDTYGLTGGGKSWWDALPVCPEKVRKNIREKLFSANIDINTPGWAGYCYFS